MIKCTQTTFPGCGCNGYHADTTPRRDVSIQLSEDQRNTIAHGLRIAVERFEENARELRAGIVRALSPRLPSTREVEHRLAEQFDRQATEARAMADLIDGAEFIELGPEVE